MHKLIAVALLGLAGAGSALAAAPTTQIFQQRTADGSLLLTDHPAAGAKTERSWQVEREDPAAARQRAIDVKAEANLVTERVQRMLDRQQRRADDDALRMRMASMQSDRDQLSPLDAQDGISYGFGGGLAIPFRGSRFTGLPVGNIGVMDPLGTRGSGGRHGTHGKPSGSGSHGSHSRW
jgi:hypothetical protein